MMRIATDPVTGKRKYTGLPSLKQSQHYPAQFGTAVAEMFAAAVAELRQQTPPAHVIAVDGADSIAAILGQHLRGSELWSDANMSDVVRKLCMR
jgi:hypothetical protein